jgi:hypothetical protein
MSKRPFHVHYDSILYTTAMMAAIIQIAANPVSIALMPRSKRWFMRRLTCA